MQQTAAIVKPLSNFIYRAMQVGVLLVAAGTILGGVWADYSWGRFWGWDPKEVWALITLLVYLIPLHGRFAGWVSTFGLVVASVVCFLSVIMAWYGVNFVLGVGLHSYGFVEGGSQGIMSVIIMGVLALPAAAGWRRFLGQRSGRDGGLETILSSSHDSPIDLDLKREDPRHRRTGRARVARRILGDLPAALGPLVEVQPQLTRARLARRAAANSSAARPAWVRTPCSWPSRTLTPAAASLINALSTSADHTRAAIRVPEPFPDFVRFPIIAGVEELHPTEKLG